MRKIVTLLRDPLNAQDYYTFKGSLRCGGLLHISGIPETRTIITQLRDRLNAQDCYTFKGSLKCARLLHI